MYSSNKNKNIIYLQNTHLQWTYFKYLLFVYISQLITLLTMFSINSSNRLYMRKIIFLTKSIEKTDSKFDQM